MTRAATIRSMDRYTLIGADRCGEFLSKDFEDPRAALRERDLLLATAVKRKVIYEIIDNDRVDGTPDGADRGVIEWEDTFKLAGAGPKGPYVVSPRDGSAYTVEDETLVQYPILKDDTIDFGGGCDVDWQRGVEPGDEHYLRGVEATLKAAEWGDGLDWTERFARHDRPTLPGGDS